MSVLNFYKLIEFKIFNIAIAAEIAAKKSRLKQKLVKSARSVAIFSLKLKERRAREAERLAQETADVRNCFSYFEWSLKTFRK